MRSLIAMSVDGLISPQFELHPTGQQNQNRPFGWGIGWYPEDQKTAVIHKDPSVRTGRVSTLDLIEQSQFRSGLFLWKVREGDLGYTHHETQPFSRNFAGSQWLFCHSGQLDKHKLEGLFDCHSRFLEPIGRSDSELAFSYLLGKVQETEARTLREIDPATLRLWLSSLDLLGSADLAITDGTTLVIYHGQNSTEQLYYARLSPPTESVTLRSARLALTFDDPRDCSRTKLIFSSEPFPTEAWTEIVPGQLLIACQGAIVWNSLVHTDASGGAVYPEQPKLAAQPPIQNFTPTQTQTQQAQTSRTVTNAKSVTLASDNTPLAYRIFDITHITEYLYTEPVLHSTHRFRLQPQENAIQGLEYSVISISSPGEQMQFEDVFGNQTLHFTIHEPYTALRVENQSRVKVFARPQDDISLSKRQTSIPIVWMPWQRQMMTPYLLPQELPDTQLEELTKYAMSFVERNDYHLLDTMKDINVTIYRDYTYSQGNTSLNTTPFEVYTKRLGVCQDFANLLICLARLLGVPARYQMGYIHTGSSYENKIQSEASHAWAELYLPYIGWRGYDPTNGCLVAQDHICVARGRNYQDATPTSGTLFKGGGQETLAIDVKVQEV